MPRLIVEDNSYIIYALDISMASTRAASYQGIIELTCFCLQKQNVGSCAFSKFHSLDSSLVVIRSPGLQLTFWPIVTDRAAELMSIYLCRIDTVNQFAVYLF